VIKNIFLLGTWVHYLLFLPDEVCPSKEYFPFFPAADEIASRPSELLTFFFFRLSFRPI